MELETLISAIQIVELSATSRTAAIEELVRAGHWDAHGISTETVMRTIEEREATAQTVVTPGFAMPHAVIDWDGDFRVILGRSRAGVDYGAAVAGVHLIVLIVIGKVRVATHLELLADIADLLKDDEFRRALIEARDSRSVRRLVLERAGRQRERRPPAPIEIPRLNAVLVYQAVQLVEALPAQTLLLAVDRHESVPWEPLLAWTGRLLIVTTKSGDEWKLDRADTHLLDIPHASLSRMDRANLALLLAAAKGLVDHQTDVVCVTGPRGQPLDSITVTKPAAHFRGVFAKGERAATNIPPAVILRVLSLAIELAAEGREAQPVGAMFVVGDDRHVMRYTQQLVLNPFHGFSRRLRNVLDPSLAETIKEFALLDGAFIIKADGTVLSAGTYLLPQTRVTDLPGGLGTRHQAAAAITAETRSTAITISQSTGTVTVFQNGGMVLTLERATLTRW